MKTIKKIELAMAAAVMPFVAMSEPTDEDLCLIETMIDLGDNAEEVCGTMDDVEGLRHVRIPATKIYANANAGVGANGVKECICVMHPVSALIMGQKVESEIEGSCLAIQM